MGHNLAGWRKAGSHTLQYPELRVLRGACGLSTRVRLQGDGQTVAQYVTNKKAGWRTRVT